MVSYNILGLITARGGSKSIPKKNLYPVLGKPLLLYTIEAAQKSKLITRLIVSTDDEEIAKTAYRAGVEVPFMRPAELAQDLTPDYPVVEHALLSLKEREEYIPEAIVHLRPTSLLRAAEDIDDCIRILLANSDTDSVRSVCTPTHSPVTMYHLVDGSPYLQPLLKKVFPEEYAMHPELHNMPRQTHPQTWFHIGDIDVIRTSTILEKKSMTGEKILPFFQENWRNVDIDTVYEIRAVESLLKDLSVKGKKPWQR